MPESMIGAPRWLAIAAFATCGWGAGCGSDGGGPSDTSGDGATLPPQPLGASCSADAECVSGTCMVSQYGTPFCTRACDTAWEPCPAGDDAAAGGALCISFEDLPNTDAPPFEGELQRFCVPRCDRLAACQTENPGWEACAAPSWLGDPLFPALGSQKVCQSPSFHGKEPVDPGICDWEKTIGPHANEAQLCRAFCDYMDRCKELEDGADPTCCEWGCFNRIIVEDTVQDAWRDEIRCLIETHAAFPEQGPRNACTEPPKECGAPTDPTPPAAR